jgi:membrane-associated phospholipid phosphatase
MMIGAGIGRSRRSSLENRPLVIANRSSSWIAVDWAVATYSLYVAAVALVFARNIPQWPLLVVGHTALVVALLLLPPRGAKWEQLRSDGSTWLGGARRVGRFLRYTYPALLLTPFFEEVRFTVTALGPGRSYWFEPHLYAADRALFGTTPAVAISQAPSPLLDELMHALYFSYYPIIIGGIVIAWLGKGDARPGAGFHTTITSMMLSFFFSYVWYPFLPARGPWENTELMAGVREFQGYLFTPLVRWMIDGVAVSGGCFPSAHVAGTWGLIVGLAAGHRRQAMWFGLVAAGLSVSCVYTRYHHAVDIFAGLLAAAAGGALAYALTTGPQPPARRNTR